jgi:hypothetical protein
VSDDPPHVIEGPNTDPFGGNDSDQGFYGPVGETSGGPTPQPSSCACPPGPPGPPGPEIDRYAATRIVSSDPTQGTDLTIQSAIDNLPPEGGLIFIKQGSYSVSASSLLGDKSAVIRGAGQGSTVIDLGANAVAAFTIQNTITAPRFFLIADVEIRGSSAAGQEVLAYQDSTSQAWVTFERILTAATVETILDIQASDPTFTSVLRVIFSECNLFPTALAASTLLKTAAPAGTFGSFILVEFLDTVGVDEFAFASLFTLFWDIKADADIVFRGAQITVKAGSNANGLHMTSTELNIAGGDFTFFGQLIEFQTVLDDSFVLNPSLGSAGARLVFKQIQAPHFASNTVFVATTLRIETSIDPFPVVGCYFDGAGAVAFGIDCDTADHVKIADCEFNDPSGGGFTTAAVHLHNTTDCHVHDCHFDGAGGGNTVLEDGTSNDNLVHDLLGSGLGAGLSLSGVNTIAWAHNNH